MVRELLGDACNPALPGCHPGSDSFAADSVLIFLVIFVVIPVAIGAGIILFVRRHRRRKR